LEKKIFLARACLDGAYGYRAAPVAVPNLWHWKHSPHIWQGVAANLNYIVVVLLRHTLILSPAKRKPEFATFMVRQLR